jgi:hypothetical protein
MNTVPGLGRNTFAVSAGPLPANPQRPEKLSRGPSRSRDAPRSRRGVYESTARRSRRAAGSQGKEGDRAVHRQPHGDIPVPLFIPDEGAWPGLTVYGKTVSSHCDAGSVTWAGRGCRQVQEETEAGVNLYQASGPQRGEGNCLIRAMADRLRSPGRRIGQRGDATRAPIQVPRPGWAAGRRPSAFPGLAGKR